MKEIYRAMFISLNEEDGIYYVLLDGLFYKKFVAENDSAAIEEFKKMVF